MILVTKLFVRTCIDFGLEDYVGDPDSVTSFKVVQTIITTVYVIYPLSLAKSIASLRYISMVSIFAILYTFIVIKFLIVNKLKFR
jgi:amino acid permease